MTLRPVDLRAITAATLKGTDAYNSYKKYLGVKFRDREMDDVRTLLQHIDKDTNLSEFFVGFNIPQINKEFDLLKFCKNHILNIELKSHVKPLGEIEAQLKKNQYYLSGFEGNREPILFTYQSESDSLFELEDGHLIEGDWSRLNNLLHESPEIITSIDKLCNPTKYLVSPFNLTEKFLSGEYFLTQQQQVIKNKIDVSKSKMFSIQGNAGTGKTLVVYDIAKTRQIRNENVLICHCGILNSGHAILINKGWKIVSIKDFESYGVSDIKKFDVIILDEVQRVGQKKILQLFDLFKLFDGQIIFSGDPKQYLHPNEAGNITFQQIEQVVLSDNRFKLTDKIRSNPGVASFIKLLFNKGDSIKSGTIDSENIFVEYFDKKEDALKYAHYLKENGWEVIVPTSSRYNYEFYSDFSIPESFQNSHHVIGQEFGKVATFIGPNFSYKGLRLVANGTYYSSQKMLFENLTRAQTKLCLIVINNVNMLENILSILD